MIGAFSHYCGPRGRSRRVVRFRRRYAEVRTITAAIIAAIFVGGVMLFSYVTGAGCLTILYRAES